jgi:hypothetical protein
LFIGVDNPALWSLLGPSSALRKLVVDIGTGFSDIDRIDNYGPLELPNLISLDIVSRTYRRSFNRQYFWSCLVQSCLPALKKLRLDLENVSPEGINALVTFLECNPQVADVEAVIHRKTDEDILTPRLSITYIMLVGHHVPLEKIPSSVKEIGLSGFDADDFPHLMGSIVSKQARNLEVIQIFSTLEPEYHDFSWDRLIRDTAMGPDDLSARALLGDLTSASIRFRHMHNRQISFQDASGRDMGIIVA